MNKRWKIRLWVEAVNGGWAVIVSAPGVEIDRIGPMGKSEADAWIAGAVAFGPEFVEKRNP